MKKLFTSFAAILILIGIAHVTGSTTVMAHPTSAQPMQHCQHCINTGKNMPQAHPCTCCKCAQCSHMNRNSQPMMMHKHMQDNMMHQGGSMSSQEMMHGNMPDGMMQRRSPHRH